MPVIARFKNDNSLHLAEEVSEREPYFKGNLSCYYPLDYSFEHVNGASPTLSNPAPSFTPLGTAIDVASENLWTGAYPFGWVGDEVTIPSSWAKMNEDDQYDDDFPMVGVRLFKKSGANHSTSNSPYVNLISGETYCISVWVRALSPDCPALGEFTPRKVGATNAAHTTIAFHSPTPSDEWQRAYHVFKMGETVEARPHIIWESPVGKAIEVRGMQLEKANYPSSYMKPGTPRTATTFSLPILLTNDMTISFTYTSFYPLASMSATDQSTCPLLLQVGDYYTNPSISFWSIGKSLKTYLKGATGAQWQDIVTHMSSLPSSFWENNTHTYTLVFDRVNDGSVNYILYIDGSLVTRTSLTAPLVDNNKMVNLTFGIGNKSCGIYRDLSVWSRGLSPREVGSHYRRTLRFSRSGTLIVPEVNQGLASPKDMEFVWFPLDISADSMNGGFRASTAEGMAFEDGECYITNAVTNLAGDFTQWSGQPFFLRQVTPYGHGTEYQSGALNIQMNNNSYSTISKSIYLSDKESCTISAHAFVSSDSNISILRLMADGVAAGVVTYDMSKKGTWQMLTLSITANAPGEVTFSAQAVRLGNLSGTFTGRYIWSFPQIEKTKYRTPFIGPTDNTRPATSIAISDKIIDLSNDFTIFGWYMVFPRSHDNYIPILTMDNGGTNRLLIMGDKPSIDNRLTCWFGNETAGDKFKPEFSPQIDFNQWRFFALTRSGGIMTLYDFIQGGTKLYEGTSDNATLLNDTGTSAPWLFGQWNSTRLEGKVKNFGFVQRAMTTDEIRHMITVGTRFYLDTTMIEELHEGEEL